jgi:hypothetical protein
LHILTVSWAVGRGSVNAAADGERGLGKSESESCISGHCLRILNR